VQHVVVERGDLDVVIAQRAGYLVDLVCDHHEVAGRGDSPGPAVWKLIAVAIPMLGGSVTPIIWMTSGLGCARPRTVGDRAAQPDGRLNLSAGSSSPSVATPAAGAVGCGDGRLRLAERILQPCASAVALPCPSSAYTIAGVSLSRWL
jgi:hypothetical protein